MIFLQQGTFLDGKEQISEWIQYHLILDEEETLIAYRELEDKSLFLWVY